MLFVAENSHLWIKSLSPYTSWISAVLETSSTDFIPYLLLSYWDPYSTSSNGIEKTHSLDVTLSLTGSSSQRYQWRQSL